jgi:hypothetical protein
VQALDYPPCECLSARADADDGDALVIRQLAADGPIQPVDRALHLLGAELPSHESSAAQVPPHAGRILAANPRKGKAQRRLQKDTGRLSGLRFAR